VKYINVAPARKTSNFVVIKNDMEELRRNDDQQTAKNWRQWLGSTTLNLYGKPVTDASMPYIAKITTLKDLTLEGSRISDIGAGQLSGLTNLQYLSLANTGIGDGALKSIQPLKNLELLNLYGANVTGDGLKELRGLPKLKKLYVSGSKVRSLAGIAGMSSLTDLDLTGLYLNDEAISALPSLTNLEELWLGNNNISAAGLYRLQSLSHLKALHVDSQVVMASNGSLSTEIVAMLSRLPKFQKLVIYGLSEGRARSLNRHLPFTVEGDAPVHN
jgi:Leucine-rich repeat (LRR) protein